MTWRDVVVLAWRSLRRRPGRAVLSVVAVALAASLFTALLTIAATARTRVLDQLAKGGPLAGIEVVPAQPDPTEIDRDDARPGEPRDLDDAALQRIAAVADVRSVVPVVSTRVVVVPPDPTMLADGRSLRPVRRERGGPRGAFFETLVGFDLTRAADVPVSLLAGRLPAAGSRVEVAVTPTWLARYGLDRADAAAMIGVQLQVGAPRFFGDRDVRARWARLDIVGVVAQEAAPGALLASVDQVELARSWTLAGVPDDRFVPSTSPYSAAFVVAAGLDRVAGVRNAVTDIGYSTRAPENLIATVQRYLHVVELVLVAIGVIAIGIAALGVTNALLAAVRERRREIGVIKALGARDRDVLRLVLVEAGALGLVGGLVGTVVGLGLASAVAAIVNSYLSSEGLIGVRAELPVRVAVQGVLGATLLAMAAGLLPAWRAARLPAREAVDV